MEQELEIDEVGLMKMCTQPLNNTKQTNKHSLNRAWHSMDAKIQHLSVCGVSYLLYPTSYESIAPFTVLDTI